MKTYTIDEMKKILEEHAKWLKGEGGERADLRSANLSSADLRSADLYGADLRSADLRSAKLTGFGIPDEGELIVWKKVQDKLVKLAIPPESKRIGSLIGRKCRAEFVRVISIEGGEPVESNGCGNGPSTRYVVGEIVRSDSFDDDIRVECSHGIHFFLTRKEAEDWRISNGSIV